MCVCVCVCGDVGLPALTVSYYCQPLLYTYLSQYTHSHMHKHTHVHTHKRTHSSCLIKTHHPPVTQRLTLSISPSLSQNTYACLSVLRLCHPPTRRTPQTTHHVHTTRCSSAVCVHPKWQLSWTRSELNPRVLGGRLADLWEMSPSLSLALKEMMQQDTLYQLRNPFYLSAGVCQTGPDCASVTT